MDIGSPRNYLSLILVFMFAAIAAGCTDTTKAEINVSTSFEGRVITIEDVDLSLTSCGWGDSEKENGYISYDRGPKSGEILYLVDGKDRFRIIMVAVGSDQFYKKHIDLYKELVKELTLKYGKAVQFDKETSKGQPLFPEAGKKE